MGKIKLKISAQLNIGLKRENNEDNIYLNGDYIKPRDSLPYKNTLTFENGVFAVCDGMGGEEHGEYASLCGVKTLADYNDRMLETEDREGLVNALIEDINSQICAEIKRKSVRIGSTISILCINNGMADIFNIGDSRVYLIRKNKLTQLSLDHTLVRQKVDMGIITKEQAETDRDKHKLTQHLGIFPDEMLIEAYHITEKVKVHDEFLICSDGLTDMLSDNDIEEIVNFSETTEQATDLLMKKALGNGGKDNTSIVLIKVSAGDEKQKKRRQGKTWVPIVVILVLLITGIIMEMNFGFIKNLFNWLF